MAGYTPWGAAGAAAAKRANKAAFARHRAEQREEYNVYRAEQRACGYEVESFEEWLGEVSPRKLAEERAAQRCEDRGGYRHDLNDICYYGDRY